MISKKYLNGIGGTLKMLVIDNVTRLAELIIDSRAKMTSVEARQIATYLVKNGYDLSEKVRANTLKEVRELIRDRATRKELGREYMTEYSNGYIDGMIDSITIIDVLLGENQEVE